MQERLEPVTRGGSQHGRDGLRTIRLPLQALHTPPVQGMEDITDSLDGTPHELRHGLRGQPAGTRQDDLGPPDTDGVRGTAVGLQLATLIIGQGSDKYGGFHSPSIPLEVQLHKNSCGNALGAK
jgi:hypothetical protein